MKWTIRVCVCVCVSVSTSSPPPPDPSPVGHHRVWSWAPCAVQQLPTSYLFYHGSVHMSTLLSQFVPPALPLYPHICSLCLHLYFFPANKFICTIFLDSVYICINIQYLFFSFWLTSLCVTDSTPTHINCCCSVAKSCLTLCSPMNCSMPGFPVLHYFPKCAQTHVR